MKQIYANNFTTLALGRMGENFARKVVFDVRDLESLYGPGDVEVIYQRPGDAQPYPLAVQREGTLVTWDVTSTDTEISGDSGKCELRYYVGEVLAKSKTWQTWVETAMDTPSETAPPEPEQGWVDQVVAVGAAAQASADAAKADADRATALAAEVSKKAAQTAQDASDAAKAMEAAQTAQRFAEEAQSAAEAARTAAAAAQAAAEQSATDAAGAKQDAETALQSARDAAAAAANALESIRTLYQEMQTWAQGVIQDVDAAGSAAVQSVQSAGDTQVQRVTDEGTTQTANAKAQADAAAQSASGAAQSAKEAAESAAVYDDVVADVNQLKQDLANLYVTEITIGKNKLNPNKVEINKAIQTATIGKGEIIESTNGSGISELIEIPKDTNHLVVSYVNSAGVHSIPTFSAPYGIWFYKEDKSYDSNTNVLNADIPNTAKYLRLYAIASYAKASNRIMIEFSDSMTEFEPYEETLKESGMVIDVENKIIRNNVITVGTGKDYESLVDAIEQINDSSELNRYTIEVYEGEYQTVDESKLAPDYKGLIIPDYVSILGIGDRNRIIIVGSLPSDADPTYANIVSTINLTMNGTVENVTIKAKNIRYCNHDDGSTFGMVRASHTFKNCVFLMEMNDSAFASTAGHIVGIGAMKNKEIIFDRCTFINHRATYTILIHDNNRDTQEVGSRLVVNECNFVNKNGQTGTQCICLSNSGGGMENNASIVNSNLYNGIRITSASTSITTNKWKLFACGNNNYRIRQTVGMDGVDLSADITAFNNVVIN